MFSCFFLSLSFIAHFIRSSLIYYSFSSFTRSTLLWQLLLLVIFSIILCSFLVRRSFLAPLFVLFYLSLLFPYYSFLIIYRSSLFTCYYLLLVLFVHSSQILARHYVPRFYLIVILRSSLFYRSSLSFTFTVRRSLLCLSITRYSLVLDSRSYYAHYYPYLIARSSLLSLLSLLYLIITRYSPFLVYQVRLSLVTMFLAFIITFFIQLSFAPRSLYLIYRSLIVRFSLCQLLSLLFPYYSLVAHNISLVALFSFTVHRSFHSLFSSLIVIIAHFIRSFLCYVYRSSLCSSLLLCFIVLLSIAHFSSLLTIYRSSLSLHYRSSLYFYLSLSFIAHFIRSSLYLLSFILRFLFFVHRSFHSLFSLFLLSLILFASRSFIAPLFSSITLSYCISRN